MNLHDLYEEISSVLLSWSEKDLENPHHFSRTQIDDTKTVELANRVLSCMSEDASSDRRIRLIKDGQDLHPAQFYESRIGDGLIQHTRLKNRVVDQILKTGGTVVVDHAHEVSRELRTIKELVESHFGVICWTQAYVTQSSDSAFGMHSDDHPFIIFQIFGRKRWQTEHESPSFTDSLISPGSISYFPRGYSHKVSGIGELSIHLTLAFDRPPQSDTNLFSTRHGNGLPYSLGFPVAPETRARLSLAYKNWSIINKQVAIEVENVRIRLPLRFEPLLTLLNKKPRVSAREASLCTGLPLDEVLSFWQKGYEAGLLLNPLT